MRSLFFGTALFAAAVTSSSVWANQIVIQQGPLPGGYAHSQHVPSAPGANPALGFVQGMVATRMPGFAPMLPMPVEATYADEAEEPLADPIAFAGDWVLLEVRGHDGEMLVLPDDRIETTHFSIDEMGAFDASAGCNPIFGIAEQDAGVLSMDAELQHSMMCFVGMEFEYPLELALNQAELFAHSAETLVFLDDEGNKLARFAAH